MDARRQHHRYNCELKADLRAGQTKASATLVNVSLGGGYFLTEERSLALGTQVSLEFEVPTLEERVRCDATIRWTTDEGIGVQFASLKAMHVWGLTEFFKQADADEE